MGNTVTYEIQDRVARITLNRPEIHNAFNDEMLADLIACFDATAQDKSVRAVVLTGEGKSFCAGADLNWMRKTIDYTYKENLEDARQIATLMEAIYCLPQPVIARVNGTALGGGLGLVCAPDIAVASDTAKFSLSEVKIGLVPACISPYVIEKAGARVCRELFITGERFTASRALELGLINYCVPHEALDAKVNELLELVMTSGPQAISICKEMIRRVSTMTYGEANDYTPDIISQIRISEEGQEGIKAFFEKRKPKWVK